MRNKIQVDFAQFEYALSVLGACTDDYMYILDFKNDHYALSETALDIFCLDESHFFDATEVLKSVIFSEDYDYLCNDLKLIKENQKTEHNLEYRWLDKTGNPIWISCKGAVVYDEDENPQYLVGRICEIGKQNKIDNNTSLYKENVLKTEYNKKVKSHDNFGYMLTIGIDNFKEINEKHGVAFGDRILAEVSSCIKRCICHDSDVYRLGGDEFAVLCNNPSEHDYVNVKELYKNIRREVDKSIEDSGYHTFYTISAGAVFFDTKKDDYNSIMKKLRFSLHCAKINGKNTFVEYNEDAYSKYIRRLDIQECLRKSIENNYEGFELYYQPIINTHSRTVHGAEALLRWNSDSYGFMSPSEFIPLLEESSLIIPIGKWVIETAALKCSEWIKVIPEFQMNINLSFVQLKKSDIVKDAMECIDRLGIPHEHFVFEVTESGELESGIATKNVLKSFMEKDIKLAIDDFGTGYSNLRYVKEMMFGLIKIDRIFIKNIQNSEFDYSLVQHITDMAHSLNLKVCYEGVETVEEMESVKSLNPDCIQGYFFGRPENSKIFEENFLHSGTVKEYIGC